MSRLFLLKTSVIAILLIILLSCPSFSAVKVGIDVLATQHPTLVKGKRLAVLTSKSALDGNLLQLGFVHEMRRYKSLLMSIFIFQNKDIHQKQ